MTENSVDQLHAPVLHAAGYPGLALKRAEIEWTREWYGVRAAYTVEGDQGKVSHFLFPSSNRYFGARVGEGASQNMNMRVPVDDTTTMTFGIRAIRSIGPESILTANGLTVKNAASTNGSMTAGGHRVARTGPCGAGKPGLHRRPHARSARHV